MHDDCVDRTSNGIGKIRDLNLKEIRMIIDYGMAQRTWINSFSGKLLEYVYKKYGNLFYYHGFYPWFILGEMTVDPEEFIDVVCMQHRYIDKMVKL